MVSVCESAQATERLQEEYNIGREQLMDQYGHLARLAGRITGKPGSKRTIEFP